MSEIVGPESLPAPVFTDPRKRSLEIHSHLRRLIIDGQLAPGAVIKQAELARVFGVSRTPMREAFRMLQEEGLIEADFNQRATIREYDGTEVDQLYGVRIALEALGVRITSGRITPEEVQLAEDALTKMDEAKAAGSIDVWVHWHREFHQLCSARAGDPLIKVINSYAERSERYLRLYQMRHPQSFLLAHDEHQGILDAVVAGNRDEAAARMAHHLAHTAMTVLYDISSETAHTAIREALSLTTNSVAGAELSQLITNN